MADSIDTPSQDLALSNVLNTSVQPQASPVAAPTVPAPVAASGTYRRPEVQVSFNPRMSAAVPSAAAPQPQVEVITIAPHPTTNRFPWTPLPNPTVPVTSPVIPSPTPPIVESRAEPQAIAPLPSPVIPPTQVALPSEQTVPPPIPVEAPPSAPPAAEIPVAIPAQPINIGPVPKLETEISIPHPDDALQSEPVALPPANVPQSQSNRTVRTPRHIYSDYTREVWKVFRPSPIMRFTLITLLLIMLGGAVAFWWFSGAPSFEKWSFLQPILHAQ